jgi:hypothetical protein
MNQRGPQYRARCRASLRRPVLGGVGCRTDALRRNLPRVDHALAAQMARRPVTPRGLRATGNYRLATATLGLAARAGKDLGLLTDRSVTEGANRASGSGQRPATVGRPAWTGSSMRCPGGLGLAGLAGRGGGQAARRGPHRLGRRHDRGAGGGGSADGSHTVGVGGDCGGRRSGGRRGGGAAMCGRLSGRTAKGAAVVGGAGSVEAVGAGLTAAFAVGDLDRLAPLLAPNVRWGGDGDTPQTCHSRAEVLAWYRRLQARGVRVLQVEHTEIRGDTVILRMTVQWPPGWDDEDQRLATKTQLFQVRDGLVVDIRDGAGHDDAVAVTGSGSPQ